MDSWITATDHLSWQAFWQGTKRLFKTNSSVYPRSATVVSPVALRERPVVTVAALDTPFFFPSFSTASKAITNKKTWLFTKSFLQMKIIFIVLVPFFLMGSVAAQHDEHPHSHKKETKQKKPARATRKTQSHSANINTSDTTKPKAKQPAADQHDHRTHDHGAAADTTKPGTRAADAHTGHRHDVAGQQMGEHSSHASSEMTHSFSRHLPMNRNGSGTGWLPDNAPMYGYMYHANRWMFMLHGNLFLRYNKQDLLNKGIRGDAKFDAPNWAMFMGQRPVGNKGLFRFSTMISLDPLIAGGSGYPLLFQTGESWKGRPLIDRQHPHDLFSELSVGYTHAFSSKADVFAYLGYPGEPALGPVAFMHRPSTLNNPDAPLTHHWVDATHITFGVATVGVRYNNWKLEGSSFTGREPGENRYNFDKPRFDSWSGRLSYNPSAKWALQVSHGFIKEPEALHPGEDVNRTTASATFSARGFGYEFVNVTALWGMNKTAHHQGEHGALLEGTYVIRKLGVFGRYEWVQKSVEELALSEQEYGHDAIFPVHAFTAGVNYDLFNIGQTRVAAGGQFSFYNPDKRISGLYGQNPLAGQLYLRIYPAALGQKRAPFFLPY